MSWLRSGLKRLGGRRERSAGSVAAPEITDAGLPARSPEAELLDLVGGGLRHRGSALVVRQLDPPGLLARASVHLAQDWYFQYRCHNLVWIEHDGAHYVVPPADDDADAFEPACAATLDSLPGYELSHVLARLRAARGDAPSSAWLRMTHVLPSAPDLDLAAALHDDLVRAVTGPADVQRTALGLLDVLATREGIGSAAYDAPAVLLGDEAEARVFARDAGTESPHRAAGRWPAALDGAELSHRAWLSRTARHDATVGGYRTDEIAAILSLSYGRWRYARQVVWCEDEPGIEMS